VKAKLLSIAMITVVLAAMVLTTSQVAIAATEPTVSDQEAFEIARDAYVYGYPMMLMDVSFKQFTNYSEPTGIVTQAPYNQFSHAQAFPPSEFKTVVRPNVDTLYSSANLDLDPEPIVLSVPATDRYFMLPLLSMWTDVFAVPGTRTTGRNTERQFLLVSPTWQGEVPSGLEIIRSPTRLVGIGGRTQTNGVADYELVHQIQQGYKLTPLSAWGKGPYTAPKSKVDPAVDMKTPPPAQIEGMDAKTYFGRFALLLNDNPPGPFDYPMVHRLERIGFHAGRKFDLDAMPPSIKIAFERAVTAGKIAVVKAARQASGEGEKGWVYTTRSGAYGVDYLYRAAIALCCLGENLPQDAVYPSLSTDSDGQALDGNHNYVLRFAKGEFPPADAFWSVTAYDPEGYFIANSVKRQAIGDRDKLVIGADGSLELYIQTKNPGTARAANWLPVDSQPFTLMMRIYSPTDALLTGAWTPPPVRRSD
jgi:hypothetical protein